MQILIGLFITILVAIVSAYPILWMSPDNLCRIAAHLIARAAAIQEFRRRYAEILAKEKKSLNVVDRDTGRKEFNAENYPYSHGAVN